MANSQIINSDWIDGLKTVESESVQCCVTSPPYWGLRDYGVSGQLGLEKTPEEYVEKMVAGFREVKRVLRNDGTLWVNLGDSYSGGGQGGHADGKVNKLVQYPHCKKPSDIGLKQKDIVGIPWMVAFALRADGWYLRQDIIWSKPNPMPESVTDRCTKSHEYIFLLTKSARYFYDNEAIKEPCVYMEAENHKSMPTAQRNGIRPKKKTPQTFGGAKARNNEISEGDPRFRNGSEQWGRVYETIDIRNKRSVWNVATQPYKEAHFATFPQEIPRTCILAGSKKGDTILDPFCGSGTTGEVALKLDRNFIGIELNQKYVTDLIIPRLDNVDPLFRLIEGNYAL